MTLTPAVFNEDILPVVWFESSLFRMKLSALIYLSLRVAQFILSSSKSQVENNIKITREFVSVCFWCGKMSHQHANRS